MVVIPTRVKVVLRKIHESLSLPRLLQRQVSVGTVGSCGYDMNDDFLAFEFDSIFTIEIHSCCPIRPRCHKAAEPR